jgi:hypothetical protein
VIEYQTPTLGRITQAVPFGARSVRVCALAGRIRIMFDGALIQGMCAAAKRAGDGDAMASYLKDEAQMPTGSDR